MASARKNSYSLILKETKAFGIVLKGLRRERNLSQEALADNSQLDRTFISLLERGLRQPTIATLWALARALSLPPSQIIKEVERQISEGDTN